MNPIEILTVEDEGREVQYLNVGVMAAYIVEEQVDRIPRSTNDDRIFDSAMRRQKAFNERWTHYSDKLSQAALIGAASKLALKVLHREGQSMERLKIPPRFYELDDTVWSGIADYYEPRDQQIAS